MQGVEMWSSRGATQTKARQDGGLLNISVGGYQAHAATNNGSDGTVRFPYS